MEDNIGLRRKIHQHIGKIKSADDIFTLFSHLNYSYKTTKRKKESFNFKKDDVQRIKNLYSITSFGENLPVFLLETKTLNPSFIRSVTTAFDKQYLHFLLIFATDYSEIVFMLPNREKTEKGEHKLKLTKLIIDRDEIINKKEGYTIIETLSNIRYEGETNWRDVWRKWKKAFSVERVTEAFFEDYKKIFFTLRDEVNKQNIPRKESHEFTLQFLNRLMFIYFISKKKWLEYPKFVGWLWKSYKNLGKYNSNEFYEIWLKQIFLKAFNNRSNEITGYPEEVNRVISNSPYLNGGLFKENDLDKLKVEITDKLFQNIFDFFEKYNFTIKEDIPLDQEVAVDPQMIGYVYESLANVAEEIYDRNDLGIFYTPRVEVDFMCRRVIVEYLSKHLPDIPKDKIYHLVFDSPEEKEKLKKEFGDKKIWYEIERVLDNLSAVDPACGSGAFLVGLLNVLAELYRMVYANIKNDLTDFELKKRILQYSLYGVDVMPWASHAAELRLWLQLIVEGEFKKEELRKHPLLPNLNLNLRVGDSLIQEIGGLSFNLRTNEDIKPHLREQLDNLKQEKRKYFENSPTVKFKTPEAVRSEETRLFEEIIDERIEGLKKDTESLENNMKKQGKQVGLFNSEINVEAEVYLKEKEKINATEKEIQQFEEEIEKLKKIKELLKNPEKKPFVWDIDFAEIFGDKNGFDIVIGNPPYVRQEKISPPNKLKAEITLKDRKEYKEKLIKSVKNIFPIINKINKKSDYYTYFYFHGLGLLNEKGTFCFITSNSWLDVGYGRNLQEFLLRYAPVTAIYDNPKRSFAHADVNTIIALFGAPIIKDKRIEGLNVDGKKDWPMLNHTAKFVMFKKPFEEVLNTKNLIEIENAKVKTRGETITELVKNVKTTQDYRVFPILQGDLLEDGWEYPENYDKKDRFKAGSYEGNKWGGKYLRAPDIFYTILEKGKGKLVELGKIAKVSPGIKSGINKFFYLDKDKIKKLGIEKEYLKQILKTPKEYETIILNESNLRFYVLYCNKSKKQLKGTNILSYIEWAEKQKKDGIKYTEIPSVKGRNNWYSTGEVKAPDFIFSSQIGERFIVPFNNITCFLDYNLYGLYFKENNKENICCMLNSAISFLFYETLGRFSLGEGLNKPMIYEVRKFFIPNPNKINSSFLKKIFGKISKRKVHSIFEEFGLDPSKPIREQEPKPLPDRAELDKIIFDELGLTEEERKEVYWSVCELVKQRLEKAGSLRR